MKLSIEHLCFGYSDDPVLDDINLEISGPGLYCIIGPNGVGKSTLIKCMNRILEPTSGCVRIDGRDIKEMSRKEIALSIGYVPVDSYGAFSVSVLDTVMLGRHNHRKWGSEKHDLEVSYRAMRLLRIRSLMARNCNELSAGQRQKVSIARGLVQETPVLLLDEPTANLDVKYQVYVTELLRGYAEKNNVAVLMICHDLNITAKYAHSVIMMARPGRIHCIGAPEETLTKENIREVYGVECDVVNDCGYPYVILGESLMDREDVDDIIDPGEGRVAQRLRKIFR